MSRLRSNINRKYKKAADVAREALGQDITVYYKTGNKLPYAQNDWDPVNNELLDPNDPLYNGNVFMDEITSKVILAVTSRLGLSDKHIPLEIAGGRIDSNEIIISCRLSEALLNPAITSGETIFHRATKIVVNGDVFIPKTTPMKYGLSGDLYGVALKATRDSTQ